MEWAIGVLAGLVVGVVIGMLIMRNNYKGFANNEAEIRRMILAGDQKAEQIVARIRNKLNV